MKIGELHEIRESLIFGRSAPIGYSCIFMFSSICFYTHRLIVVQMLRERGAGTLDILGRGKTKHSIKTNNFNSFFFHSPPFHRK